MRLLPFDYAVRNLARRPLRTALAAGSAALVAALLVGVTGFVRGLDKSFAGAAAPDAAIVLSAVAERDVVRSTVTAGLPELIAASVRGVKRVHGVPAVSGEIHMATHLRLGEKGDDSAPPLQAFIRGVGPRVFLVHPAATLIEGRPPGPGEVIVGRLAAAKLGASAESLAVGRKVRFETQAFEVVGVFAAPGTTLESEIWTPVGPLQGLVRRDDLSVVFVRFDEPEDLAELELFAKRRLDLELVVIPASVYYKELAAYLAPIGKLAWLMAALIAVAALLGGANTLNASVQDRGRELAMLRAVGYRTTALAASLLTESLLLAAGGGLLGLAAAQVLIPGAAVRIAMSAFALEADGVATLVGAGSALALGVFGVLPALIRVARLPVAAALKD